MQIISKMLKPAFGAKDHLLIDLVDFNILRVKKKVLEPEVYTSV